MWIEIDDHLPEGAAECDLATCAVFEAVALAAFRGQHLLHGSRATLKWLIGQGLSGPAKAAVSRSHELVAERGALKARVHPKLFLVPGGDAVFRNAEGDWIAPIRCLTKTSFGPSNLLAENLRDAAALQTAGRHYQSIAMLNTLRLSLAPANGGGNEILRCFRAAIASQDSLTMVVTDSDKDHPEGLSALTSRACAKDAVEASWVCYHRELPCREIENVLPFNLVKDSVAAINGAADLVSCIESLDNISARHSEALLYLDLKAGTPGHLATGSEGDVARQIYWRQVTEACQLGAGICEGPCPTTRSNCTCKIALGMGDHVLQRFLDHCQMISIPKQVERMRTSPHWKAWLDIGEEIFNWGLADRPIRT